MLKFCKDLSVATIQVTLLLGGATIGVRAGIDLGNAAYDVIKNTVKKSVKKEEPKEEVVE